jgi:hypothetical protein
MLSAQHDVSGADSKKPLPCMGFFIFVRAKVGPLSTDARMRISTIISMRYKGNA